MLDEVQEAKTEMVEALINGAYFTQQAAKQKALALLSENLGQVLDILDDALYAYIHDTKINEART